MDRRYLIFEPEQVSPMINETSNYEIIIAVLSWLVDELKVELKDRLSETDFGVIKTFGKFGGAYPGIAIYSDKMEYFDAEYKLIEAVSEKILQENSVRTFVRYVGKAENDWTDITKETMK